MATSNTRVCFSVHKYERENLKSFFILMNFNMDPLCCPCTSNAYLIFQCLENTSIHLWWDSLNRADYAVHYMLYSSELYEVQVILYVPLYEEIQGRQMRKSWRPCDGLTFSMTVLPRNFWEIIPQYGNAQSCCNMTRGQCTVRACSENNLPLRWNVHWPCHKLQHTRHSLLHVL
jgi:hypothetical protein